MGNTLTKQFRVHRFLGLAVCHSGNVDPRRLEHYTYTFWTAEMDGLLLRGGFKHCLVAPQLPIYVSSKEPVSVGADNTAGSMADGKAKSVYVDVAILLPVTEPRFPEDIGAIGPLVAGKSLAHFFDEVLPKNWELSPRCVRVIGLQAPLLAELKRIPPRHSKTATTFHHNLIHLLNLACQQAKAQARCLFASSAFARQDRVILVAGAGDYYQVCIVTREWAIERLDGFDDLDEDDLEEIFATAIKNGAFIEKLEDKDLADEYKNIIGHPRRIREQIEERDARYVQRCLKREALQNRLAPSSPTGPNSDHSRARFSDEELGSVHRQTEDGVELFEVQSAQTFFTQSESAVWSRLLRLGTSKSNDFMEKIQDIIGEFEVKEETRRKKMKFANAL
ncbi:hypothetical protein FB45DRAFT_918711 [Roridomyces roridus]|uniref:Uncharacterized protein n=1 Tax=Roridomyces roridus TaxID=1738132 RepID=A0AAD7FMQ0_9AGAR|nr:hypothetical protein FB45DRAFT_918711 [Roridomyces roridus]